MVEVESQQVTRQPSNDKVTTSLAGNQCYSDHFCTQRQLVSLLYPTSTQRGKGILDVMAVKVESQQVTRQPSNDKFITSLAGNQCYSDHFCTQRQLMTFLYLISTQVGQSMLDIMSTQAVQNMLIISFFFSFSHLFFCVFFSCLHDDGRRNLHNELHFKDHLFVHI